MLRASLLLLLLARSRATTLELAFAPDGSYALTFDGAPWAVSDATSGGVGVRVDGAVRTAGADGGLALDAAPAPIAGASPLGPYVGTELSFGGGLVIARAKHVALPSGAAAVLCVGVGVVAANLASWPTSVDAPAQTPSPTSTTTSAPSPLSARLGCLLATSAAGDGFRIIRALAVH